MDGEKHAWSRFFEGDRPEFSKLSDRPGDLRVAQNTSAHHRISVLSAKYQNGGCLANLPSSYFTRCLK